MDLDGKWQWVRRKLPRRLIPPGELLENADGRGFICGQLNISQSETPSPQQLSQEEVKEAVTAAAVMASRRGDSSGQQQGVRRKESPKSPPRRAILNQKLERVRAELESPTATVYENVGKASSGGSRGISGAGADEEEEREEEEEDRRKNLLAALMDVDGAKKQRHGASTKKIYSSSSLMSTRRNVRRASTMTVTTGSTKGSGEGAAAKPTKTTSKTGQHRDSTYSQRQGSLHGTAAIDSTSSRSGTMASTGSGSAWGTKGATDPSGGAVEQESGAIQLKPPIPIDHRRKSRLPDYFGEGDEKSLGFNLRNLHLFPLLRTPLEGEEDEGGRESGAPTSTAAPRDL